MSTETTINLTELELDVIDRIITDEYSDGTLDGTPWSWSVADGSKSRAAVIGSLKEKGIVDTWDNEGKGRNRDMVVGFTTEGKKIIRERGIHA